MFDLILVLFAVLVCLFHTRSSLLLVFGHRLVLELLAITRNPGVIHFNACRVVV